MPNIFKMSNAGGFKSLTRYWDMLAGNTVWNPWSPTGAYDALATVTVPSGGVSSVTFSGIPAGYKHLQIRTLTQTNRATYNLDSFGMTFNGVGGTSYATHYMQANNQNNGTVNAGYTTNAASLSPFCDTTSSTGVGGFGAAVIDILDYANTSKYKTVRALSGGDSNGGNSGYYADVELSSGLFMNTSAISSITFFPTFSSLFNQYSQFALYGVK
jgi:hypothetical protein